MSLDAFDDWDGQFLDEAVQAEEAALSVRQSQALPFGAAPLIPPPYVAAVDPSLNFSPPRELSQRCPSLLSDTHSFPLLNDMVHAWKERDHLKQENVELKKDRDKIEEQLKRVMMQLEAKDAEINHLKRINVGAEVSRQVHTKKSLHATTISFDGHNADKDPIFGMEGISSTSKVRLDISKRLSHDLGNPLEDAPIKKSLQMDGFSAISELKRRHLVDDDSTIRNGCSVQEGNFLERTAKLKCPKSIGVQIDLLEDQISLKNKLLSLWHSPNDKKLKSSLPSKLLATCLPDLSVLLRCMGLPSEKSFISPSGEMNSDVALNDNVRPVQPVEAAKVSQLYSILTKITNEMVHLDVLLEALLDLCVLENDIVVFRSLRILRTILQQIFCFGGRDGKRDRVIIIDSENSDVLEEVETSFGKNHEKVQNGVHFTIEDGDFFSKSSVVVGNLWTKAHGSSTDMLASINLISLFETMHRIVVVKKEECVRAEALSVMNLILMRSNPMTERERFEVMPLFQSASQLLQKGAGLTVQQQALRLLFLLLNCPKLLSMFCGSCDHDGECDESTHAVRDSARLAGNLNDTPKIQGLAGILEGLAGCVASRGCTVQELKFRRLAMIVLAFIASSGKSGYDIMLNFRLGKGTCFLELVVQILAWDLDAEAAESAESHELYNERILLMRETLILLNRLASNPAYSASVLSVLTSSKANARLTVDVANRIFRRSWACRLSDGMKRTHTKEAEIAELARVFKSRVFTFLGNNVS